MDKADLYWNYYAEQREQGRSFDVQRMSIGNFVMTVAGALLAFAATRDFSLATVPVLLFVSLLGLYGTLATQKLYERQEYHYLRARRCLQKLDELVDPGVFLAMRSDADAKHYREFKLATRMESRLAWFYLHGLVILAGLCTTVYALVRYSMTAVA